MKTMTTLMTMASELYEVNRKKLDKQTRYIVSTALECGEEGHATDELLEWAIAHNVVIPETIWSGLREYYAPMTDDWGRSTQRLIAAVAHAA